MILRLETLHLTLLKLFEQNFFLSNCSKQLVTPVNLTRKFFHKLFNFQDWEHAPKAKKLPFIEVISAIVYSEMSQGMSWKRLQSIKVENTIKFSLDLYCHRKFELFGRKFLEA